MDQITITVPAVAKPHYAEQYERLRGEWTPPSTNPILQVNGHDAHDGYGIAGANMRPGDSRTFRVDRDYLTRLVCLQKSKPDYPLFVHAHATNEANVHIAWRLHDGNERGAYLKPGLTVDLRDFWAVAWIIEDAETGGGK